MTQLPKLVEVTQADREAAASLGKLCADGTVMKTHLDLFGWEIRRVNGFRSWFHLIVPGLFGPAAAGDLPYIKRAIERRFNP